MHNSYSQNSRSPPLHHPQPTHPPYDIPEPPGTPPAGYMRFQSSSQASYGTPLPSVAPLPQQQQQSPYGRGRQQFQSFIPPVPQQLAAWGVNDATAQMGMQFGRSAVAAGQDYVERNISTYVPRALLKHQFNVSNQYVLSKLRLVLFPWRHRPWSRQVTQADATGPGGGWKPPREDINSPDLYIPSMAIVTYILLRCLYAGLQKRFDPELLGVTASKAFGVIMTDFFVIKLGCYLLAISGPGQVIDIFAYSGYKFEGIVVVLLGRLLGLRGFLYGIGFCYIWLSNAFFMLRSLRYVVLPDPRISPPDVSVSNSHTVNHTQRSHRRNFLFFVAASQVLYMWFLSV